MIGNDTSEYMIWAEKEGGFMSVEQLYLPRYEAALATGTIDGIPYNWIARAQEVFDFDRSLGRSRRAR